MVELRTDISITSSSALQDCVISIYIPWVDSIRSDFGDIRFKQNGTDINYYIVQKQDSSGAIFDVKVPTIDIGTTIIQAHCGGTNTTTTSNPNNVYLFFDDATSGTSNWVTKNATLSVGMFGGTQAFNITGDYRTRMDMHLATPITLDIGLKVRGQVFVNGSYIKDTGLQLNSSGSGMNDIVWAGNTDDPGVNFGWPNGYQRHAVYSGAYQLTNGSSYPLSQTWYDFDIKIAPDSLTSAFKLRDNMTGEEVLTHTRDSPWSSETTFNLGFECSDDYDAANGAAYANILQTIQLHR